MMTETMVRPEKYTREGYPKLFAAYGDRYFKKRVHPFMEKVAVRIGLMPQAPRFEYLEFSARSTPHRVILFADFSDGVRLWVSDDNMDAVAWDRWNDRHLLTREDHARISEFFARSP